MHANFADLTPDGFHFWMTLSLQTSEPMRHAPVPPWSKILATPLAVEAYDATPDQVVGRKGIPALPIIRPIDDFDVPVSAPLFVSCPPPSRHMLATPLSSSMRYNPTQLAYR